MMVVVVTKYVTKKKQNIMVLYLKKIVHIL